MAKPTNKPTQTNEPDIDDDTKGADLGDFTEQENLGFPAYWKIRVGAKVAARVMQLDDSDPEFQRWVFQATRHNVTCQRGPAKDAKMVTVEKGDFFSTSAYAQFGNNESSRGLHALIGEEVMLECVGEIDTGKPSPMFDIKVHVTKETRAKLLARRQSIVDRQFGQPMAVATTPTPSNASA